jgi:hypothetical protein
MTPRQLRKLCQLKPEAMSILKAAMEERGLSARALDKVFCVSRTIADLEGPTRSSPSTSQWPCATARSTATCGRRFGPTRPNDPALELTLCAMRATIFHLG